MVTGALVAWCPLPPSRRGWELDPDPQEPRSSQLPGNGTTLACTAHNMRGAGETVICFPDKSFKECSQEKGKTFMPSVLLGWGKCIFTHPALRSDHSTVCVSLWGTPPPSGPLLPSLFIVSFFIFNPKVEEEEEEGKCTSTELSGGFSHGNDSRREQGPCVECNSDPYLSMFGAYDIFAPLARRELVYWNLKPQPGNLTSRGVGEESLIVDSSRNMVCLHCAGWRNRGALISRCAEETWSVTGHCHGDGKTDEDMHKGNKWKYTCFCETLNPSSPSAMLLWLPSCSTI